MSLTSFAFISFLFLSCLKGLLITENREEIIGSATYQKERSQPPLEPILLSESKPSFLNRKNVNKQEGESVNYGISQGK